LAASPAPRSHNRLPELRSLQLIEGSLSARRIERQAPWLAGLHRISSGALVGLGLSMLGLSALTLHWQNQWAHSFAELEASKTLEHRMQEASAVLEQHHLSAVRRPGLLEPTSSEKLIHLPEPQTTRSRPALPLLAGIQLRAIPAGY
jgi:fructosamine-3-kinase